MRIQLTDRSRLILVALMAAILGMAVASLLVVYLPPRYADEIQGKWVRFGAMTSVFVAFSLKAFWKLRTSLSFWLIFLIFLLLHVVGVGHLWAVYNGLSTTMVGLLGGAEWGFMGLVIYWVLGVGPDLHAHRPRSPWIPSA